MSYSIRNKIKIHILKVSSQLLLFRISADNGKHCSTVYRKAIGIAESKNDIEKVTFLQWLVMKYTVHLGTSCKYRSKEAVKLQHRNVRSKIVVLSMLHGTLDYLWLNENGKIKFVFP